MIQTYFGEHWVSVCLGGEYTLCEYLEETREPLSPAAFYAAARSSGERVLAKLLPVDAANGEERLLMWRRTAHLRHPNLLPLLDCGHETETSAGTGCLYAIFQWPEDRLGAAVENGPLSEAEVRDLLSATLAALRYLHAQGLVYGSLDAAHVVAVGNVIKLTTDDLHEPDDAVFTTANDVRALGALLYRSLTGNEFADGADWSAVVDPFARIIRNTVKADPAERWKIAEISSALPAAAVLPEPVPQESAPPAGSPTAGVAQPIPPAVPMRHALHGDPPKPPLWAWPASVAAILGCIALVLHTPAPKPRPQAPAPAPAVAPRATLPSDPVAAAAEASAPVEKAAPHERTVWRVIAYTYESPRDAHKKVEAINRKWPFLEAEVFAPKGRNRPPYLVALGGRMNRLEAARVLQQARRRGLPRNTFMLNFSD